MGRPRLGVDQSRAVAIVPSACPWDRTRATQFSYFHTSRRNLLESPKNGQAALNMARPKTSGLVDYEVTSSEEDEHSSDLESPDGSPLAASSTRRPRWSSNESLSPSDCPVISSSEQSQLQLQEIGQAPDGPSPEVLAVESSSDEEQEVRETTQPSACRQEELKEEDEVEEGGRQTPSAGEDSDSQDEGLAEQDGAAAALPVLVQSSSEEEEEEEKLPAAKRAPLQVASRGAQGRGAYALKFRQLTPELRDLLARSRAFFTKPHSLQRPGGPVAMSTYSKAEERILCKFLGCVSLRTHHTCVSTWGVMIWQVDF